jgi:RNA polymerase sigma factor (sigma-70 family)
VASSRRDEPGAAAFRAGDPAALAEVYARWSPLVYSLALSSLHDVTLAEEVTQTVFTRAWTSRETFDPARARLPVWLVDLACRSITTTLADPSRQGATPARTSTKQLPATESKTGVLTEEWLVADEMSHLDTLSARVLRMALPHDLSLTEIAERTGLRVEEVRSRVATGLMELRHRLEVRADAH